MEKLPQIIFTDPPSRNYPHIFVYVPDFFYLMEKLEIQYVYSAWTAYKKDRDLALYFTNGGFIIAMSQHGREYLNEKIPKNFDDFYNYLEVMFYGAKSIEEFFEYKESGYFTGHRSGYEVYLRAKELGFSLKAEYDEARKYGITDYYHYREYKASDMGYNDFIGAKKGGFTNKQEYSEAKKLGITSLKELDEFKKHKFDPYLEKIEVIRTDALEAYNLKRYEEFVRLEYLLAEKLVEALYFKTYETELVQGKEEKMVEILESLGKKLNRKFNGEMLDYWRRERNLVVHEHKKIDESAAKNVKQFFEAFYTDLLKNFT